MCIVPDPSWWGRGNGVDAILLCRRRKEVDGVTVEMLGFQTWGYRGARTEQRIRLELLEFAVANAEQTIKSFLDNTPELPMAIGRPDQGVCLGYAPVLGNRRIVERLRFLQQTRAHTAMLKLSIGEHVTFRDHDGEEVRGRMVRYNCKTVAVLADDGVQWRVSPGMLCKMAPEKEVVVANVITLPRS